jgi:CheY-like chemotaxis protein
VDTSAARILLVDDDDPSRYAASKALVRAGYTVTEAKDYVEALAIIQSDARLDVLVTDVVMPDSVHGFALARMARMRRPEVKILYMTAYDIPTVEAVGKVLRKPLSDDVLVGEVRALLNQPS